MIILKAIYKKKKIKEHMLKALHLENLKKK